MSNFIYYEKLEDYEEQVRKAKECDEKDKEIERLKSRLEEYQEYVEINHKEIERLKKREQECIDHYLVQCKYASEMEGKYIIANNIINEFEKWVVENIKLKPLQTTYFFNFDGKQRSINEIELQELKRVFNKLHKLKGVDK